MERKDYLIEELSKEEKSYLAKIILNVRRRYIKNNYDYLNSKNIDWSSCADVEGESVLDAVMNKCSEEIKSAFEFEKVISDSKLYNIVKALSLKEKMVLFSLYKENKTVNQIALEMNLERTTIWRIKNKIQDKILKDLLGGGKNV